MDTFLQFGLVNALFATILALPAWLVGRTKRWPTISHSLWLLVLLKLVTPPLIEVQVPWPDARQTNALTNLVEDSTEQFTRALVAGDEENAVARLENSNRQTAHATISTPRSATHLWTFDWQTYGKSAVVAVWILGAGVFWSVAIFRIGQVRFLLRNAQPGAASLQQELALLAQNMGVKQPPRVWLLPLPIPPMLWAVIGRPRLLLPLALWERLNDDQRQTLLVHELVHLCVGDHWVRRLELIALGLYWWHPIAWWARRELLEAEELRCDAGVVTVLPDSTVAYAQTLLDTVAFLSRARTTALWGASSMGQVQVLKRRLAMILQGNRSTAWSRACAWCVLGLGVLLMPLLPTRAQTRQENAPPKPEEKSTQIVEQPSKAAKINANQDYRDLVLSLLQQELGKGSTDKPKQGADPQLAELEKKLAELAKEIEALRQQRTSSGTFAAINLQPLANVALDAKAFHSGRLEGNNLATLPLGERTLGGVPFKIGKQLIQLGKAIEQPEKVEDIKVGRKLNKLHILHATGYIAEDGAEIAKYTVHYGDGAMATIPVVYGEDVLDWWKYPFSGEPTRGKVVWNGENEPAKRDYEATIRLYMTTWENPKPDLRIDRIDYEVSGDTPCLPFCVAITAESKAANAARR